ncbi:MAG: hypothetical protein CMP60_05935 [Flavobacteriales bacterium]|nr:hypothetical protein [Flavobacteriales bacterium]
MKKLLLLLLCVPLIGFGQWSSVGVIPNFSQNQSGQLQNNNFMDFKINNSTEKKNTPLFYIYDDGTVERKMIVE